MFNIKDAALAAGVSEDDFEDDSVQGTDHAYLYFENGLVLSALRGLHPNGTVFGDPKLGTVEAAILKVTFAGLAPYNSEDEATLMDSLNEDEFKETIERVRQMPQLSFAELLEGMADIESL